MIKRTLDPDYINVNLLPSVDMLQKMSSYIDLLGEFPNEVALNTMYWHTGSHSDPTTSKISIYEQLNSGKLKLKEAINGVKTEQLDESHVKNKHFRDQLPEEIHLKTSDSSLTGDPVMAGDTEVKAETRTVIKKWTTEDDPNSIAATGKWIVKKETTEKTMAVEPLPEENTKPVELSEEYGMKDMTPQFIMWWLDKFHTSHKIVKNDLLLLLGEDNEYFVDFSESVGQLKNLQVYSDTSTCAVWDYDLEVFGGTAPNVLPGVAEYNAFAETIDMVEKLSFNTNKLYRNNIKNIMEDPSADIVNVGAVPGFSQTAHGNNLVDDGNHVSRMWGMVDIVLESIEKHLKGLYVVLEMLSVKENYRISGKPAVIDMKVEDCTQGVDLLKNKIKRYTEELNQTTSIFGRATKYGTRYRTNDYLKNK